VDIIRVSDYLDPREVLEGYRKGIFPMGYSDSALISWHLPEVRGILPLDAFHASKSLARTLRQRRFEITFDQAFEDVVAACGEPRDDEEDETTWITARVREVYTELFRAGHAHSVEVWVDGQLAGGTYGIHQGSAFFAESKFHRQRDMSKVALAGLVEHLRERNFSLLDVQYWTPHLAQFGVIEIDRNQYYWRLREALRQERRF
jgi:leucyl/phenylalanyl-tRNA--protein transferase